MTLDVVTVSYETAYASFFDPGVTMFRISKKFGFESSHHLVGLAPGHKCMRDHGHSYTAELWVRALRLNNDGFVTDFADLKPFGQYLADTFDHRCINDVLAQPTSELLAEHLYYWAVNNMPLPDNAVVDRVRVAETGKTWAEYTLDSAMEVPA